MSSPRIFVFLPLAMALSMTADAGVFNIPHFVPEGEFAIGLEPEVVLGDDSGVGMNAKYTHGLSDQIDAQIVVGTGQGPYRFRTGGNLVLDLFPDLAGQPGIGLAVHTLYYNLRQGHETEIQFIPYLHKSFVTQGNSKKNDKREARSTAAEKKAKKSPEVYPANDGADAESAKAENDSDASEAEGPEGNEIDPFVALPFGYAFAGGKYRNISSISVGANFKLSDRFAAIFEFSVPINNTQTVVSGGLVFSR